MEEDRYVAVALLRSLPHIPLRNVPRRNLRPLFPRSRHSAPKPFFANGERLIHNLDLAAEEAVPNR